MRRFKGGKSNFILDHPDFEVGLTDSLVLDRGTGSATFTRATVATVEDFDGLIKTVNSGEIRFKGARRVENLVRHTNIITGWTLKNATITSGVTDPEGGSTAFTVTATVSGQYAIDNLNTTLSGTFRCSVWMRRRTGSGIIRIFRMGHGVPYDITSSLTTEWQRISPPVYNATGNSAYVAGVTLAITGDAVDVWHPMAEDVTGQSNQNPSEYVSVGVLSAPYHGANVDGVKYFDYLNGNTVTDNVVTEARGLNIPYETLKGAVIENTATNYTTYSEDFSDASYKKYFGSSITANQATAPDGTLTADLLTFNGTTHGQLVKPNPGLLSGATHTISVWVKSDGTTQYPQALYTTYGAVGFTPTDTWTRLNLTITPPGSGVSMLIVNSPTNSSSFYIWGAQIEQGEHSTSYIKTGSSIATRNAEVLSYPSANNIDSTVEAMSTEFTTEWTAASLIGYFLRTDSATWYFDDSGNIKLNDGTNAHTGAVITGSSSLQKVAISWGNSLMGSFYNSFTTAQSTFDNNMNIGATLQIGCRSGSVNNINGTLKNVNIWERKLPTNLLVGETA